LAAARLGSTNITPSTSSQLESDLSCSSMLVHSLNTTSWSLIAATISEWRNKSSTVMVLLLAKALSTERLCLPFLRTSLCLEAVCQLLLLKKSVR
jgi:hypothetical protein